MSPNAGERLLTEARGRPANSNSEGLPDGPVYVGLIYLDERSGTYRLSAEEHLSRPRLAQCDRLEGQLDHDIGDLTILLEPGKRTRADASYSTVDPAVIADFNDAKAGPITGIPPRP